MPSKPPSKDSPNMKLSEARSRMTRSITEISQHLAGDGRSVLDRYLTTFNHIGKEEVLPVTLRPHVANPERCTSSNSTECLFHLVGTMVKLYWEFAEKQTITAQRAWDAVARKLDHIASKGWSEYTSYGNDETGYWLVSVDQADRLSGEAEKAERARRGG